MRRHELQILNMLKENPGKAFAEGSELYTLRGGELEVYFDSGVNFNRMSNAQLETYVSTHKPVPQGPVVRTG